MAREFKLFLVDTNNEEFDFHLPNELDNNGNPIPHREWVTGLDRTPMSVKGQMPTVVHGFDKPGSQSGHTLAIFNWLMPPVRLGKRFRKVTLEIVFTALGQRGDAESEAEQRRRVISNKAVAGAHWDPEVIKTIPNGPSWYHKTQHQSDNEFNFQFDLKAGFEPYISTGPSFSWKRTTSEDHIDSIKLTGEPFASDRNHARPNGVRWTLLENESMRSGVPAFLRTAVLLRRRDNDNGQFEGRVKARYKISLSSDFRQNLLDMIGHDSDHPIIFDPKYATSASSYDAQVTSLASSGVAAKLEEEFHLVSISVEASAAKDDDNIGAACKAGANGST